MELLQEKKAHFLTEGYAVLDGLFPEKDFLAFKNILKRTIREAFVRAKKQGENLPFIAEDREIEDGLIVLRKLDPNYAAFVQRVITRSPEFFHIASSPNIANAIRSFLDLDDIAPLYALSNGVIFSFPNDLDKKSINIQLDWHKDIFFTIPKSRYVHIWVPLLYNSTEETGTLQVVPGSHKEGIGKMKIDVKADYNYRYSMAPEAIQGVERKSVEVKLGQALIFDYRLIHRSGLNTSEKIRCTMIGLIHDVSSPDFLPVSTHYSYHGQTPESYFAEVFGDEQARAMSQEYAALAGEQKGGV